VQRSARLRAGRDATWDYNVLELICGACGGRLLVETPGTKTACPHCGTVLEAPLETAGAMLPESDGEPGGTPDPALETVRMDFAQPAPDASDAAAATEVLTAHNFSPLPPGEGSTDAGEPGNAGSAGPIDTPEFTPPEAPFGEHSAEMLQGPAQQFSRAAESAEPSAAPFEAPAPEFPALVETSQSSAEAPVRPAGPSRFAFNLVVSYASAATLACIYLLWLVYFLRTHARTLDLPDLVPASANKKVSSLSYLPADKEMPPANVLRLGETRQYGSLDVTPLRVTRGPIEFQYYDRDKGYQREPEGPVLKLHLRFENVSQDQEFIPLDSSLVFNRRPDRKAFGLFLTNNFVCSAAHRGERGRHVLVFDLSPDSPWLLKGQNLDRVLTPGQSLETFIATSQENLEALSGELLWRVHFRKGYNPKSFRGVTTLIEVRFKRSDIVDEPPLSVDGEKTEGRDA